MQHNSIYVQRMFTLAVNIISLLNTYRFTHSLNLFSSTPLNEIINGLTLVNLPFCFTNYIELTVFFICPQTGVVTTEERKKRRSPYTLSLWPLITWIKIKIKQICKISYRNFRSNTRGVVHFCLIQIMP